MILILLGPANGGGILSDNQCTYIAHWMHAVLEVRDIKNVTSATKLNVLFMICWIYLLVRVSVLSIRMPLVRYLHSVPPVHIPTDQSIMRPSFRVCVSQLGHLYRVGTGRISAPSGVRPLLMSPRHVTILPGGDSAAHLWRRSET